MGRFYRLGTIAEDYTYDAFGNQLSDEPTVYNPFRYSGEYFDAETGLIYLRARYYDSSIGRFISEDPIKDGLNWYVYCGSDPVNFVDPLGLYDRYAAVSFAKDYSVNGYLFNEFYTRFEQDCTNFVSLCLREGGMQESDDWYFNYGISVINPFGKLFDSQSYYFKGSYSLTWTLSNEQYEVFTNRSGQYTNRYSYGENICIHESQWIDEAIINYNIRPGDLLYFLNPKTGEMGHTAIIVSTDDGRITYAQHDDDKNNGDLGKYLDENTSDEDYNYVFVVKIRDDA